MGCIHSGEVFVFPPEPIENAIQVRRAPPPCIVLKCRKIAPYRCARRLCLEHCAAEGDSLCLPHANPRGQGNKYVTAIVNGQIKAGKLHRADGKIKAGPAPKKKKTKAEAIPGIDKKIQIRKPLVPLISICEHYI